MNLYEEGKRRIEWMLRDPKGYFEHANQVVREEIRQERTVTGSARMTEEIEQIKTDPEAYFRRQPRPPRLKRDK